jgi:hypothetical protein
MELQYFVGLKINRFKNRVKTIQSEFKISGKQLKLTIFQL